MKLIDVSVPLDANLPTYPGNTPYSLEAVKRMARGDSSNVSTLHLSAHSGTHVDAPCHFFDGAPGAEALPLEMLVGRARVIEITSRKGVGADELAGAHLSEDVRVLIKTSNSRLWGSAEFHADYTGVTESGAKYLLEHGIKVVGVDYLSVEEFRKPGAPAAMATFFLRPPVSAQPGGRDPGAGSGMADAGAAPGVPSAPSWRATWSWTRCHQV